MQPRAANTTAVCRYRLCLWRPHQVDASGWPDPLRVLAHQLLDDVEQDRSDRHGRLRERKVIRRAKRDRCLDHRAHEAPDIGPGEARSAGGHGGRKYRRTKAVHARPRRAPERTRFRRRRWASTRARDKDSSIRRRRKWPLLGNRSGTSASAESGSGFDRGFVECGSRRRHEKQLLPEERLQRHALDRFRAVDDGHVHLAGHDQFAQDVTEAVVDVDDDLRMKRLHLLQERQRQRARRRIGRKPDRDAPRQRCSRTGRCRSVPARSASAATGRAGRERGRPRSA